MVFIKFAKIGTVGLAAPRAECSVLVAEDRFVFLWLNHSDLGIFRQN